MASLAEALAQTFLPSECLLCGVSLPLAGSRGGVCGSCWARVPRHQVGCPLCGAPGTDADLPCLECLESPPPWRGAASWGPYAGPLRDLVLLFKRSRRDELAAPLAELLKSVWVDASWPLPDAVVGVPLWWGRRIWRGFNQSELLARELAASLAVPHRRLLRRRRGPVQHARTRSQRLRLSTGAFTPLGPIADRVLLVDDVLTTGATAAACSRTLKRGGAREIYVVTLARTEKAGRIP